MDHKLVSILVFLLSIQIAESTFSNGFQGFLTRNYGANVSKQLSRLDFGTEGSFGGGPNPLYFPLRRDAVIVVHGLNTIASGMVNISNFFEKYGYTQGSVFATTYGPNGTVINGGNTVTCDYLKQVRQLIIAVNKYTLRRVVVAGYSLGSAVARKAILGGICLDTRENIGKSLTRIVSAYMSVAGANLISATLCEQLPDAPMCNNVTGFSKGSQFLKDINRVPGYEGQSVYFIASNSDEVVGVANEPIKGAQINVTLGGFLHTDQCYNTLHSQFSLATNGYLKQSTLNIDVQAQSKLSGTNCTGTVTQKPNRWNYVNPIDISNWYKKNHGNSPSTDGSYDPKTKQYVFNSGYIYRAYSKLKSQEFNTKKQLF